MDAAHLNTPPSSRFEILAIYAAPTHMTYAGTAIYAAFTHIAICKEVCSDGRRKVLGVRCAGGVFRRTNGARL